MYDNLTYLVDEACMRLPREKRERTGWWASQLGMCPTGQYLERLGVKPDRDHDARTLRVFRLGDIHEEFMNEIFELSDDIKSISRQDRVSDDELHVTGKIDFIITYQDGTQAVVETKSKHSMAFWKMLPGYHGRGQNRVWSEGEGANSHHLMQTWFYLYKTGIEKGSVLYISKDDLAVHAFSVLLHDEDLQEKTFTRIQLLNDAWERQVPPLPLPDVEVPMMKDGVQIGWKWEPHWTAKWCNYHKQCLEILHASRR